MRVALHKGSEMESLLVSIDVGCRRHRVAVGMADGAVLDQFDPEHQPAAFQASFSRIEKQATSMGCPLARAGKALVTGLGGDGSCPPGACLDRSNQPN